MNLFTNTTDLQTLFLNLFHCPDEHTVEVLIAQHPATFAQHNWKPLGGNENMYGVIENQQASPIAALVEKLTNSIDATLMRKCYEAGIDPTSAEAPRSMEEAIRRFYGQAAANWDMPGFRREQAEHIQLVASGPLRQPSLVLYDSGEGQHPAAFETTLLSLLRGNKNNVHFVQGKYNMGGSGAIVFCGRHGYQLVASRRFDGTGELGFTLTRKHELRADEQTAKKNTWYEYFTVDGRIPSFAMTELDLGLHNRRFTTGTVLKLYSYKLPEGSRMVTRDLGRSLNEYLFDPALPLLTVETKERYPHDRALDRVLYGLKRRLEQEDNKYVETSFTEDFQTREFGAMRVTCYVFRTKVEGKTAQESNKTIQSEFFKNNMAVLFAMNGQVHGSYTSEFITRALKLSLLKNSLLIHVDCTHLLPKFRGELFMGSRDRLKEGEETKELRKFLAAQLGRAGGRLAELEKRRKDAIAVDGTDAQDLLKSVTRNLKFNPELLKLLGSTFQLDEKPAKPAPAAERKPVERPAPQPFQPKRFPTFLKAKGKHDGESKPLTSIPLGGERTVRFDTDVENHYFNRVDEPGELKIALLDAKRGPGTKATKRGLPTRVEEVLNVNVSSPHEGSIRVTLNPQKEAQVGDAAKLKVSLTAPGEELDEIFWVKISDKEAPPKPVPQPDENPLQGLPKVVFMYKEPHKNAVTWEKMDEQGVTVEYKTVVHLYAPGDALEEIYINMDSTVLKNFRSKQRNPNQQQLELADKKYWTAVYLHTLFLYSITKNRKYQISKTAPSTTDPEPVDIGDYIKDLFENFYSEFILNFGGMEEMMQGLGE